MTYELAKKLKEAGFPDRPKVTKYRLGTGIGGGGGDSTYIPTLSELIEACGKTKVAPNKNIEEETPIEHLFRLGYGDEWYATYEFYNSFVDNGYGLPIEGLGSTPEEAVANLFLTLNVPKNNSNN